MKIRTTIAALLVLAAAVLLGCEFERGSKYSWSASILLWDPIDDQLGGCNTLIGTYEFQQDFIFPAGDVKTAIKLSPQDKEDREFLPQFLDLRFEVNDVFQYQINYDMKKGKGKASQPQNFDWTYNIGDHIDMYICTNGGDIPAMTELDIKTQWKFLKLQQAF